HRSTCSRTTSYTWVTASSTPPHATLFRAGPVPAVPSRGDRLPGGPRGGVPGAAVARPRAREVAARHPAPAHRRSDRGRDHALPRSEERRVGKECRRRWTRDQVRRLSVYPE